MTLSERSRFSVDSKPCKARAWIHSRRAESSHEESIGVMLKICIGLEWATRKSKCDVPHLRSFVPSRWFSPMYYNRSIGIFFSTFLVK